jgi:glycosyltransferase involved in cell wall biosynthesis
MVAPLPPPRGGISTWAESMLSWASRCDDVRVDIIDTAARWRPVHDLRRWRRALWGVGQARRDVGGFLARVVRSRPDAIHLATSGDLGLARDICVLLLARVLRLRSLYHLHFGWLPATADSGGIERAGFWLTLRLCDAVVVLDSAAATAVARIHPSATVALMPHFIDASEWNVSPIALSSPTGPRRLRILYVGWVNEAKGMRDLVAACTGLAARHDFELVLAGPGDPGYLSQLQNLAGRDAGWFRCIGEVPRGNVRALMESADVFVLPSHSEGFPYVVLEAMSMSRPIVATRVGAIPQMLDDGEGPAGELVPPQDVAALERAVERVLTDAALRGDLGRRARRIVERRFTIEAVRDKYLNLWRGTNTVPGA